MESPCIYGLKHMRIDIVRTRYASATTTEVLDRRGTINALVLGGLGALPKTAFDHLAPRSHEDVEDLALFGTDSGGVHQHQAAQAAGVR